MDYEFYETPETFTRYLVDAMFRRYARPMKAGGVSPDSFGVVCEPCAGSGAISRVIGWRSHVVVENDLDPRWALPRLDASVAASWPLWAPPCKVDWVITNPPFSKALEIAECALAHVTCGVAMHVRASMHEVLKTGPRRTWMATHPPAGILWLPRFAYQRSKTTGAWTTDSVCACWTIWIKEPAVGLFGGQFIEYAPEWVIDQLDAETPEFRARMDTLMGYTGTEAKRRAQRKAA